MLNSYLLSIANKLDQSGAWSEADAVDNVRVAQVSMPEANGAGWDKASAAAQEVQKLSAQQASMMKAIESDIKELKDMRGTIAKGARDFWRFRRSKYQLRQPVPQQQQLTDMNAFGLRGVPSPQMRKSQTEVIPRSTNAPAAQPPAAGAPVGRTAPEQFVAPYTDEVEEFFQWLEAEQARKMQQGNMGMGMMGGNMNLPFSIG